MKQSGKIKNLKGWWLTGSELEATPELDLEGMLLKKESKVSVDEGAISWEKNLILYIMVGEKTFAQVMKQQTNTQRSLLQFLH